MLNNMAARSGRWTMSAVAGVAFLFAAGTGSAQQGGAALAVVQVRPDFYMIAGAGANIGVQIGTDGVVLVNTGTREASGDVLAAIQKLSKAPIRYIINTSGDADVLGGNATFSKFPSVLHIASHENALKAVSAPTGQTSLLPADSWPNEVFFQQRKYVFFNGEGIEILHVPSAHSDGDVVVFFRRSDVVVAGNVLDDTRFPVIDLAHGGSIKGEINALNRLIDLAIPPGPMVGTPPVGIALSEMPGGTEVVSGRGRIYRQLDLVEYRDMVVIIRDTIKYYIDQKKTLEQIQAAAPAKAWEGRFGATSGPWTTRQFVEAVYQSLMKEK
jgi:glyoxylase-like metal-dependent hydrolase (beta-lactamase superfamily II)